jgi:hypothetical protein
VREEFRERWSDYYKAGKRTVGDDRRLLPPVKAQLIADQKAVLEPRRDAACAELKEARALEYRGILDQQRETRAEFGWRLEMGLDNAPFFHDLAERQNSGSEVKSAFRDAAQETTERSHAIQSPRGEQREADEFHAPEPEFTPAVRHRVGNFAISFLDALFSDLVNAGSPPKSSVPWSGARDEFEVAAEEATKQIQHHEREQVDEEWNSRQKAIRGE